MAGAVAAVVVAVAKGCENGGGGGSGGGGKRGVEYGVRRDGGLRFSPVQLHRVGSIVGVRGAGLWYVAAAARCVRRVARLSLIAKG